jgi:dGTPase
LNLSWETLEGLVKHNGPVISPDSSIDSLPAAFRDFPHLAALQLGQYAGPEAQVAALADDIAYNNHDIDDGISAGLFGIADLIEIPVVGDVFRGVQVEYPDLPDRLVTYEAIRRLIGLWVDDLTTETRRRIDVHKPRSAADVRAMDVPLVAFSDTLDTRQRALRAFLFERMYKHYRVNRMRSKAKRVLHALFDVFLAEPDTLPPPWRQAARLAEMAPRARIVCDYIAGMTDNYALEEHRRLFDTATLG